ncbi:hypothetical protein ACFLQU_00155 [Verrucomicrobiota bacterium]
MKSRQEMQSTQITHIAPCVVIILGVSWLLDSLSVMPEVNWVRTVGLATAGALVLILGGLNKLTVVAGPLLVTKSACMLLTQTGLLASHSEMPVLVIVLGCLLLLVQTPKLPTPGLMQSEHWVGGSPRRQH